MDLDFKDLSSLAGKGAFLSVGKKTNVMTIGWGMMGKMWNMPVVIVPVRNTRYSYKLMMDNDTFCVSVPHDGEYREELTYCGTKSGRDVDKISALHLPVAACEKADTQYVVDCSVYECKKICSIELGADTVGKYITDHFYGAGDFHTLFIGEIVNKKET